MEMLPVDGRTLALPALIPSISSFETQLSPLDALRLQITLQEPVSLVSAFDLVADEEGTLSAMCRTFRKTGVMFLDSGGYETSRMGKYASNHNWTIASFLATANLDLFDFAFSFDEFPDLPTDSWAVYAAKLDTLLDQHDSIPDERLIPVVHLSERKGKARFSELDAIALVKNIAEARDCKFVAVTERELGDGLSARVSLAKRMKEAISESTDTKLHILGCGNPLSFAAFAEAGVDSCDGLEWCRTYCSSDMRLYHFQHSRNVGGPISPISVQAEMLLDNIDDYYVRTSVINLNNFSHIVHAVQNAPSAAISLFSSAFGTAITI